MSEPPIFTIGILGSYNCENLSYKINTLICQTETGYELIFSFDRKYCMPVNLINDVFLAHEIDIADKITILESDDSGTACHASKIIAHARGMYIMLISIEDFMYDANVLARIKKVMEPCSNQKIYVFRTLLHTKEEYLVYGQQEGCYESNSICYPVSLLKSMQIDLEEDCGNIIQFHKNIFEQTGRRESVYYNIDENVFVHTCEEVKKGNGRLSDLYCDEGRMEAEIMQNVKELTEKVQVNTAKLSAANICRLRRMYHQPAEALRKEICDTYWQSYDCEWGIGQNQMQYLKILVCFYEQAAKKRNCFLWFWRLKLWRIAKKKLKLLFLTMEYAVWPSLKSVYDEALFDQRFAVQLVYVPFSHLFSKIDHEKEICRYREKGYDIVRAEDFDLSMESVDVAIFVKPFDAVPKKYQIQEVRKNVGLTIYIPYAMETGISRECLNYQCYGNMQYYADYILAYAPAYYESCKKYTLKKGENYLCIGHPRMDLRELRQYDNPMLADQVLQKAGNRKIILWNTHFAIHPEEDWGTFLKFGEFILDYFKQHEDLFLLWRPHPFFYKALSDYKKIPLDEVMEKIHFFHNQKNMFIDETDTYLTAFQISNAMITDWSSFIAEYIVYEKPFLITQKRSELQTMLPKEMMDIALENKDIRNFLERIRYEKYDETDLAKRLYCIYKPAENRTVAHDLLDIIYKTSNAME